MVTALFVFGTIFAVVVALSFLICKRYRRPPKPPSPAESERVRTEVEARILELALRVILLAEKESSVTEAAKNEALEGEARRAAALVEQVAASGFWERFTEVSVLNEENPLEAWRS